MNNERDELLHKIEKAFDSITHPGWQDVYNGHPAWSHVFTIRDWELEEAEQAIDIHAPWRDLVPRVLMGSLFLLLTAPCGFKFFFPSFMWHSIVNPHELDCGIDALQDWLERSHDDELYRIQLDSLSEEQRSVVRDFVAYAMRHELFCGELDKLIRVWDLRSTENGAAN